MRQQEWGCKTDRRQFFKVTAAVCAGVATSTVALVATKKPRKPETRQSGLIDKFDTPIRRMVGIDDKVLLIYTEDEVWALTGDAAKGGVLTKVS